ncbi:small GTP-binding protein [Histomonas meleagridis]|uniref:small GTP-binding protein n=1 Tax=Histomonas meleagridis TaxID=135588 RepID=UPI003559B5DE|nr:small GTP-binding protein [Histomonas meleagridis]KAH0802370.1 small GTP-binding protein [Histomonas meleagridis]
MRSMKIGVFGGGGVGKTAIVLQFVKNQFSLTYIPTIEDEFMKTLIYNGKTINLEIIDTAGQDDFVTMRNRYLSSVEGYVFVYSSTDIDSLHFLRGIFKSAQELKERVDIPCIIAANKADLKTDDSVPLKKGEQLAVEFGCEILETSAKDNLNIKELFQGIVKRILSSEGQDETPTCGCSLL